MEKFNTLANSQFMTEEARKNGVIPVSQNQTFNGMFRDVKNQNFTNAVFDAAAKATGNTPIDRTKGTQPIVNAPLPKAPTTTTTQKTSSGSSGSSASGTGSGYGNNSQYADQLMSLYDQIMGYKPFKYDLNGDLLYRQMADQYTQLGKTAMRDTMGQAAALTGGYGNSYAQQVGNQAYQQYLTALNEQIPNLYDRAYNVWAGDLDKLLQQYQLTAAHPEYLDAMKPKSSGSVSAPAQTTTATVPAKGQLTLEDYLAILNSKNANTNPLENWLYQLAGK